MKLQDALTLERPVPVLQIKKILVPIDFSAPSRKAFKYALGFAQQFGSEIVLLHVLERPVNILSDGEEIPGATDTDRRDEAVAENALQKVADSSPPMGDLYITSNIRVGTPTHEIVEAAKDLDVDLIIVATHGLRGGNQFGLGSAADRVARAAPCPVLVVREREHEFI